MLGKLLGREHEFAIGYDIARLAIAFDETIHHERAFDFDRLAFLLTVEHQSATEAAG